MNAPPMRDTLDDMNDAARMKAAAAISKFGGRKFRVAVGVLLIAAALQAARIPLDPLFVDLVKWVVGLYFAGDVGADAVAAWRAK